MVLRKDEIAVNIKLVPKDIVSSCTNLKRRVKTHRISPSQTTWKKGRLKNNDLTLHHAFRNKFSLTFFPSRRLPTNPFRTGYLLTSYRKHIIICKNIIYYPQTHISSVIKTFNQNFLYLKKIIDKLPMNKFPFKNVSTDKNWQIFGKHFIFTKPTHIRVWKWYISRSRCAPGKSAGNVRKSRDPRSVNIRNKLFPKIFTRPARVTFAP